MALDSSYTSNIESEPVLIQVDAKRNDKATLPVGELNALRDGNQIAMRDLSNSSSEPLNQPSIDELAMDGEERQGLKLGLGDFVFYSVLVGRASKSDWVVTVGSVFAVLSGLVLTILILVLKRRPLPALPISIFLGITVFLVGTLTLVPLIENLAIFNNQGTILRAGAASIQLVYL